MLSKPLLILCSLLALPAGLSAAPSDTSNLICHTRESSECYPKIFQPTEEFQIVHEDQDIPAGLHVRLNLETRLKEAKLYDRINDGSLNAVEVYATDETETLASPAEVASGLNFQGNAQQVLKSVGHDSIRPPSSGDEDGATFGSYQTILRESFDRDAIVPAMEKLEDLSHDIYWGLNLTKDGQLMHKLDTLMSNKTVDVQIKSAAALLLGTAIQNNPAALSAALNHFYNDDFPTGPLETVVTALVHEQFPKLVTRLVYLLSELCQDDVQLLKFLKADGLNLLRTIYNSKHASKDDRDRLRQKIANFVLDHFLQEDSLQGLKTSRQQSERFSGKQTHEDPRILVENNGNLQQADLQPSSKMRNMATSLYSWCSTFSESLGKWEKADGSGERADAEEHVREAHVALKKKLKAYGCSCDDKHKCNALH